MTERPVPTSDDPEAPFGLDELGTPLAPYGLTQEGRPKRSPGGRPPGPVSGTRRKAPSPPKKKAPTTPKRAQGPNYAGAVMDLARGPMVMLTVAGMKSPALLADAVAIEQGLPPIAQAIGDLAQDRPEVAAMLDRLMVAGPYTALISAVLPLALQLATNHGLMAPGTFGTMAPEQLIGTMQPPTPEQLAEWQAAAAAAQMNGAPQ